MVYLLALAAAFIVRPPVQFGPLSFSPDHHAAPGIVSGQQCPGLGDQAEEQAKIRQLGASKNNLGC